MYNTYIFVYVGNSLFSIRVFEYLRLWKPVDIMVFYTLLENQSISNVFFVSQRLQPPNLIYVLKSERDSILHQCSKGLSRRGCSSVRQAWAYLWNSALHLHNFSIHATKYSAIHISLRNKAILYHTAINFIRWKGR